MVLEFIVGAPFLLQAQDRPWCDPVAAEPLLPYCTNKFVPTKNCRHRLVCANFSTADYYDETGMSRLSSLRIEVHIERYSSDKDSFGAEGSRLEAAPTLLHE